MTCPTCHKHVPQRFVKPHLHHHLVRAECLRPEPDDYFEDYDYDTPDPFEEAMDNCSGFFDGGVFLCAAIGSEQCEFECPFNQDIGKTQSTIRNSKFPL